MALAGALTAPLSQSLPSIRDKTHTKATRKDGEQAAKTLGSTCLHLPDFLRVMIQS